MNAQRYVNSLPDHKTPLGHCGSPRQIFVTQPRRRPNTLADQYTCTQQRFAAASQAKRMRPARNCYETDSQVGRYETFKQRPYTEAYGPPYTNQNLRWRFTCEPTLTDVLRNGKSIVPFSSIKELKHYLPILNAQRWNYKGLFRSLRYVPIIPRTVARAPRNDDLTDNGRGRLDQTAIRIARIAEVAK